MGNHETETTVAEDGSIRLDHELFPAGSRVRISLIKTKLQEHDEHPSSPRHTREEVNRSRAIVNEMRQKFRLQKYEKPDEPVGLEDWDLLPDGFK